MNAESETRNLELTVLLIEDNPGDARLIRELLAEVRGAPVALTWADRLQAGLDRLAAGGIDGILLDLSLPDSQGFDTFTAVHAQAPHVPIVVLTGLADEALAVKAVREGAQDYLVKGEVDGYLLVRSLRYAIERKRAKEELEAAQLQLIQSAKLESVGRLAAGVAHEVKNPLAIIQQGLTYLSDAFSTTDGDTVTLVLKKMDNAVRRADRVVRGLLEFSGPRAVDMTTAALNAVVEESLLLVKHELLRAHVVVIKKLGENLPPLKLDRNKIEQVFVNLFMNAIQAMPDGGTLTVKTDTKQLTDLGPEAGRWKTDPARAGETLIVLEVEDTGTGIPEEKLDRVFDPFFTTKPPGQGSGLGLTVTRKLIELHGGTIDIRNRPEGGVRVTLTFTAEGAHGDAEETDPAR